MGKLIETVLVGEPKRRGFIETEAFLLAEAATDAVTDLANLARSGKIDRKYLSMLHWFSYILDDMREGFIVSDDGWGNNYTSEYDLKEMQAERGQVEDRLRRIDGLLAASENDQPAS